MGLSDWINIVVSIVSLIIATVALIQTHRQIALSNKQQLYDMIEKRNYLGEMEEKLRLVR